MKECENCEKLAYLLGEKAEERDKWHALAWIGFVSFGVVLLLWASG